MPTFDELYLTERGLTGSYVQAIEFLQSNLPMDLNKMRLAYKQAQTRGQAPRDLTFFQMIEWAEKAGWVDLPVDENSDIIVFDSVRSQFLKDLKLIREKYAS